MVYISHKVDKMCSSVSRIKTWASLH